MRKYVYIIIIAAVLLLSACAKKPDGSVDWTQEILDMTNHCLQFECGSW